MNCELCGLGDKRFYKVELDGAQLLLCQTCAKYGKIISEVSEGEDSAILPKPSFTTLNEKELRVDYPKILSDAISGKDIKLEELALEIKESQYELKKIVAGKIIPEESIALKLEKALNVSLFEKVNVPFKAGPSKNELSFQDTVTFKDKKQKQG